MIFNFFRLVRIFRILYKFEEIRAGLNFYADPINWRAKEIENDFPSEVHLSINGEEVISEAKTYTSGPALDGGEHARFVLWTLENG
jgi:hypothetical protein